MLSKWYPYQESSFQVLQQSISFMVKSFIKVQLIWILLNHSSYINTFEIILARLFIWLSLALGCKNSINECFDSKKSQNLLHTDHWYDYVYENVSMYILGMNGMNVMNLHHVT